jgi:hypothetical protein
LQYRGFLSSHIKEAFDSWYLFPILRVRAPFQA